jgi:hypothetical protein
MSNRREKEKGAGGIGDHAANLWGVGPAGPADPPAVDTVQRPGAPVWTLTSFVVEDRRQGPQRA